MIQGVFGMGRIAKSFVKKIHPFGNTIIYNTRTQLSQGLEAELDISYVAKDELCRSADVIVTLCPGTAETYHLLNYEQFKMMKDGVYLINTSRGSVVSTDALISAQGEPGRPGCCGRGTQCSRVSRQQSEGHYHPS